VFDLEAIDAALTGTIFSGRLHYAAATGSTNNDALEGAQQGAAHGSVYFADEQRVGRGRSDHAWHSVAGEGLYVSVLLRPEVDPARLTLLPLVTGLAVVEAIYAVSGLKADLRWPNDVLIGQRKVCGILVEARVSGDAKSAVVAGIGVNVHQREFAAELATAATSLDLETGRRISRQVLLVELLKSLQEEVRALEAGAEILSRMVTASTWIRGRAVTVHGPQACRGVTEGLDANGFLKVCTAEGLQVVQTGGIRAAE